MSEGGEPSMVDRVRVFVASYYTVLLAVCALLVLGGAVVAVQAHTGPDTRTEERVAGTWETNASFEHSAEVQRETLVFDAGETLQNRSVYYRSVTPVLQGSYVLDHAGEATSISSRTDLALVLRSVSDSGQGQQVLWEISEPLESTETTDANPGEPHRVAFEINVTEQRQRLSRIRDDLGSTVGNAQIMIVASTETEADVAGERVTQTRRDRLEIRPRGGIYRVVPATSGTQSESISETVEVPIETDPVRGYGSILAMLLGLAGGTGLWYLDREGALDVPPGTAATIRANRERDSFDEWISRGRVPPAGPEERTIEVDSLEDLVDVAIDSDRRVIEDVEAADFVVVDGTTRYRFEDGAGSSAADTSREEPRDSRDTTPEGTEAGTD